MMEIQGFHLGEDNYFRGLFYVCRSDTNSVALILFANKKHETVCSVRYSEIYYLKCSNVTMNPSHQDIPHPNKSIQIVIAYMITCRCRQKAAPRVTTLRNSGPFVKKLMLRQRLWKQLVDDFWVFARRTSTIRLRI